MKSPDLSINLMKPNEFDYNYNLLDILHNKIIYSHPKL